MRSHFTKYPQTFLLAAFAKSLKSSFSSINDWKSTKDSGSYERYRQTAYYLRRKGVVTIRTTVSGERFLELTKKGELELLMARAWLYRPRNWDGKWRIVIFDIPVCANNKRHKLRRILLANSFVRLQASVYVSPYPLNRLAVQYLKTTGLIDFIRIGRLEELDDDIGLRKKFNL